MDFPLWRARRRVKSRVRPQVRPAVERRVKSEFDKNSPLGRLDALGRKLEENNNKIEAAEKGGDTGAQVAAAAESLGLILGAEDASIRSGSISSNRLFPRHSSG